MSQAHARSTLETGSASDADGASNFGSLNILVVDDQAVMRKIVRQLLRQLGIVSIKEAANGVEAMELLCGSDGQAIDLVICDLCMDEMDGTEFCNQLRRSKSESLRGIPVLILTGLQNDLLDQVVLQVGAVEVAHKPISAAALGKCIERAVGIKSS